MRAIFLILSILFFGGCSLWGILDNKFSKTDWQIKKIVVNGEEYLSAQSLKNQALDEEKQYQQDNEASKGSQNTDNTNNQATQEKADSSNTALPDSASEAMAPKPVIQKDLLGIKEVSTMDFDQSQHRIYGVAGCNNYFANYNWKDETHLEIGNAGMTRKLCSPDELTTFEFRFMQNFQGVFDVIKEGSSMILDNGKMQIYLQ